MTTSKKIKPKMNSLNVKLALLVLFCFILSLCVFTGVHMLTETFIDSHLLTSKKMKITRKKIADNLQAYVTSNNLSKDEINKIKKWTNTQKYLTITIYDNDQILFSENKKVDENISYDFLSDEYFYYVGTYPLVFSDGNTDLEIMTYFNIKYTNYSTYLSLAVAGICFFLLFLAVIKRKTRYISKLKDEMDSIGGGMLDTKVMIEGNDELTQLASSIDLMRIAIIKQLEDIDRANQFNKKIVTELSHDLRTPLTSLIGYLEILKLHNELSSEQVEKYLKISLKKSYQIKNISAEIFNRFSLGSGKQLESSEIPFTLEIIDGNLLVSQIMEDLMYDLEIRHFKVIDKQTDVPFYLTVNIESLRRIFDNCLSNILKYGQQDFPVYLESKIKKDQIVITLSNTILPYEQQNKDRNGIGLLSCSSNAKKNKGSFAYRRDRDHFYVLIKFPLNDF